MKKPSSVHPDTMRLLLAANERAQDELRTILARVLPVDALSTTAKKEQPANDY